MAVTTNMRISQQPKQKKKNTISQNTTVSNWQQRPQQKKKKHLSLYKTKHLGPGRERETQTHTETEISRENFTLSYQFCPRNKTNYSKVLEIHQSQGKNHAKRNQEDWNQRHEHLITRSNKDRMLSQVAAGIAACCCCCCSTVAHESSEKDGCYFLYVPKKRRGFCFFLSFFLSWHSFC